jgi:hypothetical protein
MTRRAALVIAVAACGPGHRTQMYPAGSDKDDGYGDLAQQSAHLMTSERTPPSLQPPRRNRRFSGDPYGGDAYGGAMYGGDLFGDPVAAASPPNPHIPRYTPTAGLTGAIEGIVTWRGAAPAPLITACGVIESPGHVGAGNAVAGVLVLIEHVELGRVIPSHGRRTTVGGTITKRGCALAPALQIVTPLPAGLAIHGDATAVKLRILTPNAPAGPGGAGARPFELHQAGRILMQAQPGVTRVEADDGSLAAAWVIATDAPYYAITDDGGRFRLDELAAGIYDITLWRPPLPTSVHGKLVYGAPSVTHRTVKVDPGRPARLDVVLEPDR